MKPIPLLAFFFITWVFLNSCQKKFLCPDCDLNQPPVANAGPDQVLILRKDSTILNGSNSSDPDGKIVSYKWIKISGPVSSAIINIDSSKTLVKGLVQGIYQFELKVTDNGGLSAKDTMQVTVSTSSTNIPPLSNAGRDTLVNYDLQACNVNTITLNGSASYDPDGTIVSYLWSQLPVSLGLGPPPANILNPSSVITQISGLLPGTYSFTLKVTDNNFATGLDTIVVNVVGTNRPLINAQLTPVGTLSQTREGLAVGSSGNKIVFAGGYDVNLNLSPVADIYDVSTQSWTTATLSVPRYAIAVAAAGDKIFFAGGYNGDDVQPITYSTVDIYNASSNTWSATAMSQPIGSRSTAVLNNKIFIGGGDYLNGTIGLIDLPAVVDIYNTQTNTWSTSALSEGRWGLSAAAAGKIYFAGGVTTNGNSTNKIDIYDESKGTWSAGTLARARDNMACITIGSKIFWAGGIISGNSYAHSIVNDVEIRDVNTQTSTFACLSQPNAAFNAVMKDNKIVFFTSDTWIVNDKKKFDIYDITTNTWSIGILPINIIGASIISIKNTIYVAGGYVNGVLSNQVYKLEF